MILLPQPPKCTAIPGSKKEYFIEKTQALEPEEPMFESCSALCRTLSNLLPSFLTQTILLVLVIIVDNTTCASLVSGRFNERMPVKIHTQKCSRNTVISHLLLHCSSG
jgi:hypothetical protein